MVKQFLLQFCIVFLALSSVAQSAEKSRVALVIGNFEYTEVGRLENPKNDAQDIAQAFERLGFEVSKLENLGFDGMRRELAAFNTRAREADIAVVFFAGHGMEIDKQNYLIPTDARLETDSAILFEAIPLDFVLEAVSGAKGLKLVILDACRNNPFASSMQIANPSRSVGRGLARVEPAGGTVVAFAAKEGTVASDGVGRNSPFSKALLNYLEEPGLEIQFLFRKVRDAVMRQTNNAQQPFTYGSLPGEEIFLSLPQTEVNNNQTVAPVSITLETSPTRGQELREFRDCADCPVMVPIPDGQFFMGSPKAEPHREANEGPQHLVTLDYRFAVGKFEITRGEFSAFVEDTNHNIDGKCFIYDGSEWRHEETSFATLTNPEPSLTTEEKRNIQSRLKKLGYGIGTIDGIFGPQSRAAITLWQQDNALVQSGFLNDEQARALLMAVRVTSQLQYPVTCVNWVDAQAYVAWLSERTGEKYRLLSESEWEYVARGETSGTENDPFYASGFDVNEMCQFANLSDQSAAKTFDHWPTTKCNDNFLSLAPVGQFKANKFGIHDTAGNAWEWTQDCLNHDYSGAPTDGSAWEDGDCEMRSLRGGAWLPEPHNLRYADRFFGKKTDRFFSRTFRVTRDIVHQGE